MANKNWVLPALSSLILASGVVLYAGIAGRTARRGEGAGGSASEVLVNRPKTLEALFPAPQFAYPDQHKELITPKALAGQPYIANFIFTTCRTICPLLTTKMVQLQRRLPGVPIRFASFSVDPGNDTPEVLANYQAKWNPSETRWHLLATDKETFPQTASGFHITAAANPNKDDPDPIIHSSIFLLVDAEGAVRGVYDTEDTGTFATLLKDARTLAHSPTPSEVVASDTDGAHLYMQLSCGGCHADASLAPPLGGILGTRREMTDSSLVTADRAYLRDSIVLPEKNLVRGYSLKMPTYQGLVTPEELEALVSYVASMKGTGVIADNVRIEVDPVCGMDVRADAAALKVEHAGHTAFFCSAMCRDRFVKNPAAFAAKRK